VVALCGILLVLCGILRIGFGHLLLISRGLGIVIILVVIPTPIFVG
jgi:hypothetical protein